MLTWLAGNIATILICLVLGLLFFLAIRYLVKIRKSGGCVGCSGCNGGECPHCSSHQQK